MPKFSPSVLRQYCYDVMTASGVDSVCAEATAEMLVDAEVTGMSTHGVSRLSIYMERIQAGIMSPNNNIRIVQEAPSALTVDAGNSLGAAAAKFTMTKCIEKARETGVCFAAVRNSNHFGTAAFYTKMAAEAGMMGLCCANLKGNVAPFGAAEPYLGTNPLSLSCPTKTRPLVTDIATSTVALGKLILAQKLGKSIPEGWALDKDGNPTTDPAEGRKGMLTPFGGPKGSGIHPEDLYHIFKRFYRSRFSQDTQGIGLGLPLAKAIVEAHHGTIEVDSELGKGTTFTLNFPIPTKL